jgi:hypothetical protein
MEYEEGGRDVGGGGCEAHVSSSSYDTHGGCEAGFPLSALVRARGSWLHEQVSPCVCICVSVVCVCVCVCVCMYM